MNPQVSQDLNFKINLLNNAKPNQEFLNHLKSILEYHNLFDLATTEERMFKKVLPAINSRFNKVYSENVSIFETLDDEFISTFIRENLEVAFELTEAIQEILNFIYQHNSVRVADVESVIKCIPTCVLLFTGHWNNSSDAYKNAFNTEMFKVLEVIKHLYASFLHILELSISVNDNVDLGLVAEALTFIGELSKNLHNLDPNSVILSWKCFGVVTAKYSTDLENCMDLRIPITALCEDVYKLFEALLNHGMEEFERQMKMIIFLMKVLFKITDIFYQKLDTFALDLLIFYVKVLSLSPDHFKNQQLSEEALLALDTDVFKNLDSFLQHLVMGQADFKDQLEKIPDYIENMKVFEEYPFGLINLLCKILYVIASIPSDWCDVTIKFIEVIFATLPLCHTKLILDSYDGGIYQQLIVNISAAILLQDSKFQSAEILLRNILQDNVFVAILALEIYTLVISNVSPEECLTLFINLLYGVNDLVCGFFTSRPEMVYLKKLLQRIFKILPDTLKDEIIKLFNPDQYIQIWRFLGFNSLPTYHVPHIINPVVTNTSESIRSIFSSCNEDIPPNIAEGLDLLSTVNNLDIKDSRFGEITKFLDLFWAGDLSCNEILDNNIINYFMFKITEVTSICIQNSMLDLEMVCTKLKTLSCKESYWVPVYKIIYSILTSSSLINIPDIDKQRILAEITGIINLSVQTRSNPQLRETYLELFRNLNESHKNILNFLLDNLNPNLANQIFQYLEKNSAEASLIMDYKHKTICFKHKCLNWKVTINTALFPQVKRAKMDIPPVKLVNTLNSIENFSDRQVSSKTQRITNKEKSKTQTECMDEIILKEEEDSSAAEVIDRIKGEVKCLIKTCKTEKLTRKNVTDLRILMSQISSLM